MPRWLPTLVTLCALPLAAAQEPEPAPPAEPAPTPASEEPPPPTPAPPARSAPAAPPILLDPPPPRLFGVSIEGISPAHRLAILEAGGAMMPGNDALVLQVATRLDRLTAVYVEDAPRIADLTDTACQVFRNAQLTASPLEMLDAALQAKRPATLAGLPRRFEHFAAAYRLGRIKATVTP